jgi:glycosyltransferase involved in cell wall biosynthesis
MARILLSALASRRGGGATYVRELLETFPRGAGDRLSILSPEPVDGLPERPDVEWIRAPRWTIHPITRFLFGWFYFPFLWPRRHDFDVVCFSGGTFDAALPSHVPTVVVFRNMLPFDRVARRRYGLGWMRFRHFLLWFVQGWAMRRANLLIFISEHGRQVIDRTLKNRRGRSVVIHHAVSHKAVALNPGAARRLPERFVLYLSSVDAYKAQVELVEAWAALRKVRPTPEKLLLVGPQYPPYARRVAEAIRRCGVEGEVILFGAVPAHEVFDLAGRAKLNLFLSSCENCPHTLIELMSAGRPLLASSLDPMPELGGPDIEYVDPYDVPAVARALELMLDNTALRERVGLAAAQRSWLFRSKQGGTATWQAIRATAGRGSPAGCRAEPESYVAREKLQLRTRSR